MDGFIVEQFLVLWIWQWENQRESLVIPRYRNSAVLISHRFVDFAMHRVRMLQHFGVVPFLIFDGDYLPSKAATEADRAKRREDSKKAGLELLNAGKTSQAYLEFQKAVDVTPEMARQLIDELKKNGVQYIVAPYEADSQMVYLERKGILDGILSEDSDLLVFGAKCLLTKLDQYGNCVEINKADFSACKEITLTGWSDVEFRCMAILSGCDYLSSINNMGLKTAYRMVRKHKTIEKVLRMLAFDGKFFVPKGYLEAFYQAEHTFLHQRVFCPKARGLVLHTEPEHPIDEEKMPFIGAYVQPEIAQGVARGDLNPITKLPIVVETKVKMSSSLTPWATPKTTLQRSSAFSDLKKGKTLDNFLQPKKRIPLGELDINCFTPSPSQQEALRRNHGSWDPSPARPYLHRSSTEPLQLPQSVPAPVRSTGRTHTRTPTISEPRPPKRARLCGDVNLTDSSKPEEKAELSQSRFFRAAVVEPSPTVGKSSRSRRSRKDDITIFSDDSVEEALLGLPDFDCFGNQGSRASRNIVVFEEGAIMSETPGSQTILAVPNFAAATDVSISQDSNPGMTESTSLASSFEQPPSTPTEVATDQPAKLELKLRFSYTSQATTTPKANVTVEGLPTPVSSVSSRPSRPSRIPLAIKGNTPTERESAFSTRSSLTPLQRLGATAGNRSKFPMTPPLTPTVVPRQKVPRLSMLSKINIPFPEAIEEKKTQEVEPASVPLPVPDEGENISPLQNGSEDLIIHDSEEEEGLSPISDEAGPQIDFSRFVFAGV
jgi:exonuclease-1